METMTDVATVVELDDLGIELISLPEFVDLAKNTNNSC